MNWKYFLKPTITKVILAVVILAIAVPFINYDNGIRCIKAPCPNESVGSVIIWLIFSSNFTIYSLKYTYLIIGIILSYLLSCFLISTINIKKK